jgi:hypothetical protein
VTKPMQYVARSLFAVIQRLHENAPDEAPAAVMIEHTTPQHGNHACRE